MKKNKVFIIFVLLLVPVSLYAKHSISIQAAPYAAQKITYNTGTEYTSTYGYSVLVGHRYSFANLLYTGVDLSFSDYRYSEFDSRYYSLSLTAKYGFMIPLNNFFLESDMGAGIDFRIFGSVSRFYPSFNTYLGLGYRFSDSITATAGTCFHVAWQEHTETEYSSTDTEILYRAGIRLGL